jgi:ABC-2 type transport system ATP-binding protein
VGKRCARGSAAAHNDKEHRVIEIRGLTKRYGTKIAVDDLSFGVRPGIVTGFLGPNGAGKSTTMRLIVGLDTPTRGEAVVNGRRYVENHAPLHEVGILLEARSAHPARSAYNHLLAVAQTHGFGRARVDELIELVGLRSAARKPAGKFSLGMSQRLGIAAALLGDPDVVILDEPVNGLDPEGIRWVRDLLKGLAAEGRTVFVSSHLMSEMALTAEHLIVIGRGRLIADVSVERFIEEHSANVVRVRSPHVAALRKMLAGDGVAVNGLGWGALEVVGMSSEEIGERAAAEGIPLHELAPQHVSLEEAFMELTDDDVEYRASTDDRYEGARAA